MVVTVGIDVHKQTHCAVAVDEAGRQVGKPLTVRATDAGHRQLLRWTRQEFLADTVEFAVEDCRHVSTRLERALLDAGASVLRVPPKLMAQTRSSARTRGKSDPIDALAIARAAVREPELPRAEHTHASRELTLLVDRREDLVEFRTKVQHRLRWRLHELDPGIDPPSRALDRGSVLDRIQARLQALPESLVRRLALEELADIRELTERINAPAGDHRPGHRAGAAAARAARLRAVDGGQAGRRDRQPGPVRLRGRLRQARLGRSDPGVVRQDQPAPLGPPTQPTAQRRTAPHRGHPDPPRRPRPGLLPTPTRPGRHHDAGPAGPQTTPGSDRVHLLRPTDQHAAATLP